MQQRNICWTLYGTSCFQICARHSVVGDVVAHYLPEATYLDGLLHDAMLHSMQLVWILSPDTLLRKQSEQQLGRAGWSSSSRRCRSRMSEECGKRAPRRSNLPDSLALTMGAGRTLMLKFASKAIMYYATIICATNPCEFSQLPHPSHG